METPCLSFCNSFFSSSSSSCWAHSGWSRKNSVHHNPMIHGGIMCALHQTKFQKLGPTPLIHKITGDHIDMSLLKTECFLKNFIRVPQELHHGRWGAFFKALSCLNGKAFPFLGTYLLYLGSLLHNCWREEKWLKSHYPLTLLGFFDLALGSMILADGYNGLMFIAWAQFHLFSDNRLCSDLSR